MVLHDTLQQVQDGAFSFDLLPVWYDVDLPEDLKFLKTHLMLIAQAGLSDGERTKIILDEISMD